MVTGQVIKWLTMEVTVTLLVRSLDIDQCTIYAQFRSQPGDMISLCTMGNTFHEQFFTRTLGHYQAKYQRRIRCLFWKLCRVLLVPKSTLFPFFQSINSAISSPFECTISIQSSYSSTRPTSTPTKPSHEAPLVYIPRYALWPRKEAA